MPTLVKVVVVMGSRGRGNVRSLLSANAVFDRSMIYGLAASWQTLASGTDCKRLRDGAEATTLESARVNAIARGERLRPGSPWSRDARGSDWWLVAAPLVAALAGVERRDGRGS